MIVGTTQITSLEGRLERPAESRRIFYMWQVMSKESAARPQVSKTNFHVTRRALSPKKNREDNRETGANDMGANRNATKVNIRHPEFSFFTNLDANRADLIFTASKHQLNDAAPGISFYITSKCVCASWKPACHNLTIKARRCAERGWAAKNEAPNRKLYGSKGCILGPLATSA